MPFSPESDVLRVFLPTILNAPDLKIAQLALNAFELSFPLSPATTRHVHSYDLGSLGSSITSAIRITREKVYWLTPTIDRELPSHVDTQLLLLKSPTSRAGKYRVACILVLTTEKYMGTLRGREGRIVACFERDLVKVPEQPLDGKIVIAIAPQIKDAIRLVVDGARSIRRICSVSDLNPERHIFSDTLTYCTWNSLHPPTPATQTSVFKTLAHFNSLSPPVRPTNLLLDDAWQDKDPKTMRLKSFESLPFFLDGAKDLGEVVQKAKRDFGIRRVGVWHTIQGYWCGVDPGTFGRKYTLIKVVKDNYPGPFEPEVFTYYTLHPSSVDRFFRDYYTSLASHGVEFTKCDNMASLDNLTTAHEVDLSFDNQGGWAETIGSEIDVASIRPTYKKAVQAAAKTAFGGGEVGDEEGRVIWCMEMTPRVLLGREIGLREGRRRCVARNSDDYYPNEPNSHRYHIFTNAINTMFTSQLNVIPDLDMFQSHSYMPPTTKSLEPQAKQDDSANASYHAALRALGPGPITVTDVPGASDPSVLNKLLGTTTIESSSNRSIALQAEQSFWINNDVFDSDILASGNGKALRIFSGADKVGFGSGLIGYWNVRRSNGKVNDLVTSRDLWELVGSSNVDRTYVLRSQHTGSVYTVSVLAGDGPEGFQMPIMPIMLDTFQFDIFSVSLLETGVAVLGLINKYNPLAGITTLRNVEEGRCIEMKCCGRLGIFVQHDYDSPDPPKCTVDRVPETFLDCIKTDESMGQTTGTVFTIDLDEQLPDLSIVIHLIK